MAVKGNQYHGPKENRNTFFCKEIQSENRKQHNRGFKQDCVKKSLKKTHLSSLQRKSAVKFAALFINI